MYKVRHRKFMGVVLSLLLLAAMGSTASGKTFNMVADATTLTMPDGTLVPAWAFAVLPPDGDGVVRVPGDVLVIPPDDNTGLTINLTNNLPEPVSLQILGQQLDFTVTGGVAQGPVWTSGLTDTVASTVTRNPGDTTARVRSFAHETPAMVGAVPGTATYSWPAFKNGTYLLQSGTNPAKQVQMGLYAAVTKDAATGEAYPGVFYDKELILVYSEVDPVIHAAVAENRYGANATGPAPHITSSLHRDPKYFLINGLAFPDGGLDPINAATPVSPIDPNDRVLVRFLNAGYETHVPQLLNMYMDLAAEDGRFYTYPKTQYGVQLPAGKTIDAIIEPTADGRFSIHDAANNLTNAGAPDPGGMILYYTVGCAGDLDGAANPDGLGDVDRVDLAIFAAAFGSTSGTANYNPDADLDADGDVDRVDLAIFSSNFGRSDCQLP